MSLARSYSDPTYGANLYLPIIGNAGTTPLYTPTHGSASGLTTVDNLLPQVVPSTGSIIVKRIIYIVKTAGAAASNVRFHLYNGTSSVGNMTVTTEAAGAIITSSEINAVIAPGSTIDWTVVSNVTASADQPSIGFLGLIYQEQYT